MDPLDRPIWHALCGPLSHLGTGGALARRFREDVSPFVATKDDSEHALGAVASLVPADGALLFLQAGTVPLPPGCRRIEGGRGVQMVARGFAPIDRPDGIIAMQPDDWPDMLDLASLTKPGPFLPYTPLFGQFWGVRDQQGRLVAMAGERLKLPGFSEVSGVCTHPDARGQGLAALLSRHVASEIVRRGEVPFLHAYADNRGAIQLYERLGFVHRTMVDALLISLARADPRRRKTG